MEKKLNSNEPMKKLDLDQLEAVSGGDDDYIETYTHTTNPNDDYDTSTSTVPTYTSYPDMKPDAYPSGTVISKPTNP